MTNKAQTRTERTATEPTTTLHRIMRRHYRTAAYPICVFGSPVVGGERCYRQGGISRFHYEKIDEKYRQPEDPAVFKTWARYPVRLSSPKYLWSYVDGVGYTFYATLPVFKTLFPKDGTDLQVRGLTLGIDIDLRSNQKADQWAMDTITNVVKRIVSDELSFLDANINCHTSGRGAYILIHHEILCDNEWGNEQYLKWCKAFNYFIEKKLKPKYDNKAIKIDAINDLHRVFKVPFTIYQKPSLNRITVPFDPGSKVDVLKTKLTKFKIEEWIKPYQKFDRKDRLSLLSFLEEQFDLKENDSVYQPKIEKKPYFFQQAERVVRPHWAPVYSYLTVGYTCQEELPPEPNGLPGKRGKKVQHSGIIPVCVEPSISPSDTDALIIKVIRKYRERFKTRPYLYFWWGINSRIVVDQGKPNIWQKLLRLPYPQDPKKTDYQFLFLRWKDVDEAIVQEDLTFLKDEGSVGTGIEPMILATKSIDKEAGKIVPEIVALYFGAYTDDEITEIFDSLSIRGHADPEFKQQWELGRNLYVRLSSKIFGREYPIQLVSAGNPVPEFLLVSNWVQKYLKEWREVND